MGPDTTYDDRRKKVLLRAAIDELEAVGAAAVAKAHTIESRLSDLRADDVMVASEEMVSLRLLAGDVDQLVGKILNRERAEGFHAL